MGTVMATFVISAALLAPTAALLLRDFQPSQCCMSKRRRFPRAKFPVFDVHQKIYHLNAEKLFSQLKGAAVVSG